MATSHAVANGNLPFTGRDRSLECSGAGRYARGLQISHAQSREAARGRSANRMESTTSRKPFQLRDAWTVLTGSLVIASLAGIVLYGSRLVPHLAGFLADYERSLVGLALRQALAGGGM